MPIETSEHGSIAVTGESGMQLFRLLWLRQALKLAIIGIKMTRHMSAMEAGRNLGFKGRTAKAMLPAVEAAIAELNPKVVRVENGPAPEGWASVEGGASDGN